MQYKVPQNIDMADRIVGPLTLVQFLYLLIGGIIDYILFSIIAPVNASLFLTLAIPIGLFSFALAFLKIQDQPFGKFVISFVSFLFRPKMRVWAKEGAAPEIVVANQESKKSTKVTHKAIKKSELEKLAQALDTGGAITNQTAVAGKALQGRPVLDPVVKRK